MLRLKIAVGDEALPSSRVVWSVAEPTEILDSANALRRVPLRFIPLYELSFHSRLTSFSMTRRGFFPAPDFEPHTDIPLARSTVRCTV